MQQSFLLQVVTYSLEVKRIKNTCVFINLRDVRINAVLTNLMTYQRNSNVLSCLAIVTLEIRHSLIEHALTTNPAVVCPLSNEDIILWLLLHSVTFLEGEGRCYIEMARILSLHVMCEFVQKLEIWLKFITAAYDAKRWVIAVVANNVIELLIEELSCCRVLIHLKRPVGKLHLTVESHLIGYTECSLGWTPRVETQMVQSILAGSSKYLHPATFVSWRSTCEWENATLQCASQECRLAINQQTVALSLEATHTKRNSFLLLTSHNCKLVEVRCKLIPQLHVANWDQVFAISCSSGADLNTI